MKPFIQSFLIAFAVSSVVTVLMLLAAGCTSKSPNGAIGKKFDSDYVEACQSVCGGKRGSFKIVETEDGVHCQCEKAK